MSGGRTGQPSEERGPQSQQATRLGEAWGLDIGAQADCRLTGSMKAGRGPLVWGKSLSAAAELTFSVVGSCGRPEADCGDNQRCLRYVQLPPRGTKLPPLEKPCPGRHSASSTVHHPSSEQNRDTESSSRQNGGSACDRAKWQVVRSRWPAAGSELGAMARTPALGARRSCGVRSQLIGQ